MASTAVISLKPMLLHKSTAPLAGDYIHQLKYDGFRCLLHVGSCGKIKLYTRQQNDCTLSFPEFAGVQLPEGTILDGEMIALGEDGKPVLKPCPVLKKGRNKKNLIE
ncbi:ATP-dependent DNA ligase [Paenibacillus cremeus]|uniref:ATP-dependent DNA ligase family profile domain-containing protein n=1 Tax=Paenibacillus cremeus TaxID=2163881 RepID=A0A559K5C8_9BACL|nr:hypothetical protein [Paenibacillus cremeus]TVY07351.1 hypothetical protein FPZ49_24215 [Paenibacillus cremeus]